MPITIPSNIYRVNMPSKYSLPSHTHKTIKNRHANNITRRIFILVLFNVPLENLIAHQLAC